MDGTDRRIRRTRRLLGESLVELALEKGFRNVTIQDVTDRADIAYRTFFRHYRGLEALLWDTFEARANDWRNELWPFQLPSGDAQAQRRVQRENGTRLFEYVEENRDLFLVILGRDGCQSVEGQVLDYSRDQARDRFNTFNRSELETELHVEIAVSATFGLVRWWLANDQPCSPEQMGEAFARLIAGPVREAMAAENDTTLAE